MVRERNGRLNGRLRDNCVKAEFSVWGSPLGLPFFMDEGIHPGGTFAQ
jgi:hypothetical protein